MMPHLRRTLAHLAAVAALLVLGARPERRVAVTARDVVLATPGTDAGALRRIADSAGAALVRIPEDVADAAAFARRKPDTRTVLVTGWGLEESDAAELRHLTLVPHPSSPIPGVAHISWPAIVPLGAAVVVEGAVSGATAAGRVVLEGPGGAVDSAAILAHGGFRVSDVPRAAGRHRYALHVRGSAWPSETIGVVVTPPAAPRILIVESAPSFETRALRDWLASGGGSVAVRTLLSRDRWREELVNSRQTRLVPLTAAALREFDAVVTDARTLAGLERGERDAIEQAVREDGIGVLVAGMGSERGGASAAGQSPSLAFFLPFSATPISGLDERLIRPALAGRTVPRTAVPAAPAALDERFGRETVIRDGAGVALAQTVRRGAGTVAYTLIEETARWVRAGERDAYAAYWSAVLDRVAGVRTEWRAADGPHLVHRPVAILSPCPPPPQGGGGTKREETSCAGHVLVTAPSGAQDTVYLARDPLDGGRVRGTYWPREAGFHTLGDAGAAFPVSSAGAWRAWDAAARIAATARAAVRHTPRAEADRAPRDERRPYPLAWVFVLFVLATGYLWATRR